MALIGMLLGAVAGLGAVQLLRGGEPLPRPRGKPPAGALVGIAAGLALWLVTGWVVLGIAGGFLAAQMYRGFAEMREQRQILARRGELARVASRLRDMCLAGHGLPAAVGIVADEAGPGIRSDMAALALSVREVGVGRAFAAYAEVAPDPMFGVFARMVGEADRQGSAALSSLLSRLAAQTAREVSAARETSAGQGANRATAPIVASVAVGILLSLRFGSPSFAGAYSDATGQLMMAIAFVPIGLGYAAIVRSQAKARRMLSWGGAR